MTSLHNQRQACTACAACATCVTISTNLMQLTSLQPPSLQHLCIKLTVSLLFREFESIVAMSANTKYSAVQRDSLDETAQYSTAPPSYADGPSSSADNTALLGGPRSSEDNVPDDFKVRISFFMPILVSNESRIVWRLCC